MKYRKLKGYKYELMEREETLIGIKGISIRSPYISLLVTGILRVKKHYAWDGPSGPTIDTKTFMRGSLFHDALYQLMRENLLDRRYRKLADLLLRRICLEDGMNPFRAWYVYHAVRLFCKKNSLPRTNPRGKIIEI